MCHSGDVYQLTVGKSQIKDIMKSHQYRPDLSLTQSSKVSFSSPFQLQYLEDHDHDSREVSYRSKGLTADDVQSISTFFINISELDLSDNKIEYLPRGVPANISALNLSKNRFHSLIGFDQVKSLRMLKLSGNKIERTWGLQACLQLEYLDLSDNNISIIEGLETLTKLTSLILVNNRIKKLSSVRPLSFNTSLQELQLIGNEIITLQNYTGTLKQFIPSLKHLDGESLYFRDGNQIRGNGYGLKYDCKKILEQSSFHEAIRSVDHDRTPRTHSEWNEISVRWDEQERGGEKNQRKSASSKKAQPSYRNGVGNESIVSGSSGDLNETFGDEELLLPWRRAPFPIPKDRQGNEMYEAPPPPPSPPRTRNNSPPRSSKSSKNHPASQTPTAQTPFLQIKKEVTKTKIGTALPSPALLGSTIGTNIKGGSFTRPQSASATPQRDQITPSNRRNSHSPESTISSIRIKQQRGSTSVLARAANIKYPVYQPNFTPPKPPSPPTKPRNKFKITLGTKNGTIKHSNINSKRGQMKILLEKDHHLPQNDVIRINPSYVRSNSDGGGGSGRSQLDGIPLLADDELRQAVSPKKVIQPIHRSFERINSLEIEENGTHLILDEYRQRGGVSGGPLSPTKKKWTPPPLPVELEDDDDQYQYDGERESEDSDDQSYYSESDRESDYDDEYTQTESENSMNDQGVIQDALRIFCDQKRNTIQSLKSKRTTPSHAAHARDPHFHSG